MKLSELWVLVQIIGFLLVVKVEAMSMGLEFGIRLHGNRLISSTNLLVGLLVMLTSFSGCKEPTVWWWQLSFLADRIEDGKGKAVVAHDCMWRKFSDTYKRTSLIYRGLYAILWKNNHLSLGYTATNSPPRTSRIQFWFAHLPLWETHNPLHCSER